MRLKSYVDGFEVSFPASKWQREAVRSTYRRMRDCNMEPWLARLTVVHMVTMFAPDSRLREVGQ